MHLHIISCKQAKTLGLKNYFTGFPCKHGNHAARRSSTSSCVCDDCRHDASIKFKAHYEKNHAGMIARKQEYYRKNTTKVREYAKEYRLKNIGVVTEKSRVWREENRNLTRTKAKEYRNNNLEMVMDRERRYRADNRAAVLERQRRWRENNKEQMALYAEQNREAKRESDRLWRIENPHKGRQRSAKRRASLRSRIPSWYGEFDAFVIEEAFSLAREREIATGIRWHVDHMIPLQADLASGLHCASNIQVIPGFLNWSKNNKMIMTELDEWLSALLSS